MFVRTASVLFTVLALLVFSVSPANAEEKVVDNCKVVKVEGGKLFITDEKGNNHSAEVSKEAKITLDGKTAKLEDLKADQKVKLTIEKGDKITITKVEATTK